MATGSVLAPPPSTQQPPHNLTTMYPASTSIPTPPEVGLEGAARSQALPTSSPAPWNSSSSPIAAAPERHAQDGERAPSWAEIVLPRAQRQQQQQHSGNGQGRGEKEQEQESIDEQQHSSMTMSAHVRKGTRRVALVVDATGSMSFALSAIREMLLNVVRLLRLVGCGVVSHICLLVYRDYCDNPVTQSMTVHVDDDQGVHDMLQFISRTFPNGGGDGPEAAKTAAWELLKALPQQEGAETWVLWFADAPPHLEGQRSENKGPEDRFLRDHAFPTDWLQVCGLLKEAGMICFPIHLSRGGPSRASYFEMACITGGHCFEMRSMASTRDMAAFCLSLLSQLCGYSVDITSDVAEVLHVPEGGQRPLPHVERDLTSARCHGSITVQGDASQVHDIGGVARTRRAADLIRKLHNSDNDPLLGRTLSEFERMLDDPVSTMVLTVNELLGVLWRELCKRSFEGPRTSALKNRMSTAVNTLLSGTGRQRTDGEVLQKWLQDSYDRTEEIHDMLVQAEEQCGTAAGAGQLYLTLPHPPKAMTGNELLELIRSCHTQEVVASMFTGLFATTCKPSQQGQPYLPLFALSDEDTFRLLPHLLCPGIMFETRGACILAAMCLIKSGPRELQLKAEGLLRSKDKQWCNADAYPENRSGAFAALMCSLRDAVDSGPEPTLLPADAYHTYALALFVARLRAARHNLLDGIKTAKHAYGPGVHGRARPDFDHRTCASCGQSRSLFSLTKMAPTESGGCCCTLCAFNSVGVEEARCVSAAAGRFAQCHECEQHYLLQRPEALKSTRTKCPGCRGRLPARSLSCACRECGSVYQFAVAASDTESHAELEKTLPEGVSLQCFACPTCHTQQEDPFDSHVISLEEYLPSNGLPAGLGPSELTGSAAKAAVLLRSSGNPLSVALQAAATAAGAEEGGCPTLLCKESGIFKKALAIRNSGKELHNKVKAALEGPRLRLPCDLCAEPQAPPSLSSMCGHRACRSCVCEGCKGRWFNQPSPGTECPLTTLHCAFCKRPPQAGVLARHNPRLAQLAKNHRASGAPLSSLDPSRAYGWCVVCDRLAPLDDGARGGCCAADEGADVREVLQGFVCTACSQANEESAARGEQACPNPACGIGIQKNGGCNHMTCTMCGHHWCWLCRADFGNGMESLVAAVDHACELREEEQDEDNDLI